MTELENEVGAYFVVPDGVRQLSDVPVVMVFHSGKGLSEVEHRVLVYDRKLSECTLIADFYLTGHA